MLSEIYTARECGFHWLHLWGLAPVVEVGLGLHLGLEVPVQPRHRHGSSVFRPPLQALQKVVG